MAPKQNEDLSELEIDALWTVYEGHSLVIERPLDERQKVSAHVILSVAYDDADEAIAEVTDIPVATAEALIERGYLESSEDGPVLDEHSWYDDELATYIEATEYLLSEVGQRVIDDTSDNLTAGDDFSENSTAAENNELD